MQTLCASARLTSTDAESYGQSHPDRQRLFIASVKQSYSMYTLKSSIHITGELTASVAVGLLMSEGQLRVMI